MNDDIPDDVREALAVIDNVHPFPVLTDDEPLDDSLTPVDLRAAMAAGYAPPAPTVLKTKDGLRALFYAAAVNLLFGDSGSCKSWLLGKAVVQAITSGRHVLLIDAEANIGEMLARLRGMGASEDDIANWITYIRPDVALGTREVAHLLGLMRPDTVLVGIDSLGEAFGLEGVDENADAQVGPWLRRVARAFAEAGACVVLIDHVTKAGEQPLHPSGSKRKRAAVQGAAYLVKVKVTPTTERPGSVELVCSKDRHGHYARGEVVVTADITPYPDGGTRVNLHVPLFAIEGDKDPALILAAKDAIATAKKLGREASLNLLTESMSIKVAYNTKTAGIEEARDRGHLIETKGPRNARMFQWVSDWSAASS